MPCPEQQRRLGVAHVVQLRLQRQQLAAGGSQPGNVFIRVFVAVLRDVLAVETVKISEHRQQAGQQIPGRAQTGFG